MTQRKLEHPLVIRHHDERAARLKNISVSGCFFLITIIIKTVVNVILILFSSFHLLTGVYTACSCVYLQAVEGFHAAEVELSMMKLSPVWGLIESVAHQKNRNSCWMAVKQQLQHYCTDGQRVSDTEC